MKEMCCNDKTRQAGGHCARAHGGGGAAPSEKRASNQTVVVVVVGVVGA